MCIWKYEKMNECRNLSTTAKPISNRVGNEQGSRIILILKSIAFAVSLKHHKTEANRQMIQITVEDVLKDQIKTITASNFLHCHQKYICV